MEGFRAFDANQAVDFLAQFFAGTERGDRNGCNDTASSGTKSPHRRFHGGSGGQTVVDEDYAATIEPERETTVAIGGFAAVDLKAFACDHRIDRILRNAVSADHIVLEHDNASTGDGTHGQFFLAGNAEFTDDEDIERQMEFASHFKGDRNPTARQSEDDWFAGGELGRAFIAYDLSQSTTGMAAILKDDNHARHFSGMIVRQQGRMCNALMEPLQMGCVS